MKKLLLCAVSVAMLLSASAQNLIKGGGASPTASPKLRSVDSPAAKTPSDLPGLVLWISAFDLVGKHQNGELISTWPARIGSPLISQPVMLTNKRQATPPILVTNAIEGNPALRFANGTELLSSAAFAQSNLVGAFTLFMVSKSGDKQFGIYGNAPNGGGGVPRLYLTRNSFIYNLNSNPVPMTTSGVSTISTYQHNGVDQIRAWVNGLETGRASGPAFAPVKEFGAGGNLTVGGVGTSGDLGEIVVFRRALDERERALVEAELAARWKVDYVAPIAPEATFSQIARPSGFSPEMPKLSDVCMRLFALVKGHGLTAEQMLAGGSDFHITRGVWSYIVDKSFVESVRAKGWEFQGSLCFELKDSLLALRDKYGRPIRSNVRRDANRKLIRDNAGNYVDDGKSAYRADLANQEYRRLYLERAKRQVDMGVTSFQRDDPDEGCFEWGGSSTREALRDPIPDAELLDFHRWARTEIEKYAGKKLTFSTNCYDNSPFMQAFDYRMTEVRIRDSYASKFVISPQSVRNLALEARREKKLFMLTGQEDLPAEDYRWIWATSYATGSLYIVPWDQFLNVTLDPVTKLPRIPINKLPRFFIAPERFADLTSFVRANAKYLDGYEEAAVGGFDLQDTRFGDNAPVQIEGGSNKLSVYIRAKAGDVNAPVVVHLVEREQGAPTTLRLRTARFFGKNAIKVKLRVPLPYDATMNAKAEQNKNYETLIRETTLTTTTKDGWTTVSLPALSPWGMLVVEKLR